MAFRFKKASCVVIGTFNMYIIHPKWLAKHGIIDKGVEVGIQANLAEPEFRFLFPGHKATWLVAPHRIAVESDDPALDCGTQVAAVLRKLPETPLRAIGNNTIYEADRAETESLPQPLRDLLQVRSPTDAETLFQQSFHVATKQGEHRLTSMQLSVRQEAVELLCNVHTELRGREDTAAAWEAAERFLQDRAGVEPFVRHFWGAIIDHATGNP